MKRIICRQNANALSISAFNDVHTAAYSFEINHNNHFARIVFVFLFVVLTFGSLILICFVDFHIKFCFCLLRFNGNDIREGIGIQTLRVDRVWWLVGVCVCDEILLNHFAPRSLHCYMILFALNRLFIRSFSICTVPESIKYVIGIYLRGRLSFCRSASAEAASAVICL